MKSQVPQAAQILRRITVDPRILGGKPIIRGHRLAVEHSLGMLAAGERPETILEGYPWLELEDIQACLVYARRLVGLYPSPFGVSTRAGEDHTSGSRR